MCVSSTNKRVEYMVEIAFSHGQRGLQVGGYRDSREKRQRGNSSGYLQVWVSTMHEDTRHKRLVV